jgi:prophage tail gpP-like protein
MSRKIVVKNVTTNKTVVWKHIFIRKSLDSICHTLDMEIPPTERTGVHKHDMLEIRVPNPVMKDSEEAGGRRVSTVLVDEITAYTDGATHSIRVLGRSPARDIIDSTWTGPYKEMKLKELTNTIGKKFGISAETFPTYAPDPTQPVPAFRLGGESPWIKLVNEANNQGFLFTANEAGNLYIWKAGRGNPEHFHLTEGVNIKTIRWTDNGSEQFHEYIVTGGGNTVRRVDSTCKNNRVLTIDMTDSDITLSKLTCRAQTELRRRRATRTTVTVSGWGLTDEQITRLGPTEGKEVFWVPNILIPVTVPSLGLNDTLLISEVEYEASPDTLGCTITVVNKETYL